MRIDSTNQLPPSQQPDGQVKNASSSPKGQAQGNAVELEAASFSFSLKGVQGLQAGLTKLPEVRKDRVQALQQAIQSGSYKVTDEQIADGMLADLFGLPPMGK